MFRITFILYLWMCILNSHHKSPNPNEISKNIKIKKNDRHSSIRALTNYARFDTCREEHIPSIARPLVRDVNEEVDITSDGPLSQQGRLSDELAMRTKTETLSHNKEGEDSTKSAPEKVKVTEEGYRRLGITIEKFEVEKKGEKDRIAVREQDLVFEQMSPMQQLIIEVRHYDLKRSSVKATSDHYSSTIDKYWLFGRYSQLATRKIKGENVEEEDLLTHSSSYPFRLSKGLREAPNLLKNLSSIEIKEKKMKSEDWKKGVKQEDSISPKLFKACLEILLITLSNTYQITEMYSVSEKSNFDELHHVTYRICIIKKQNGCSFTRISAASKNNFNGKSEQKKWKLEIHTQISANSKLNSTSSSMMLVSEVIYRISQATGHLVTAIVCFIVLTRKAVKQLQVGQIGHIRITLCFKKRGSSQRETYSVIGQKPSNLLNTLPYFRLP
ncbi:hypothetical protein GQR58_022147 [Nymphon striatum]|nr:hypothetical protein GQR58_022147 [Nymphon striatum]